ncbi:MAG: T9SS type A sorting domain-containing protein [Flavobacteriales bacterium]
MNRFDRHLRSLLAITLLGSSTLQLRAQLPTSVDIDLATDPSADSLTVKVRANGASFGELMTALTFTIQWPDASGASLGARTVPCQGAVPLSPTATQVVGAWRYKTYNAFGLALIQDECAALAWAQGQWITVMRVQVTGNTGCTDFNIVNDTWTAANNRDFYVSLNGFDRTGTIEPTPDQLGNCGTDCLGVVGGSALPGTACNDNNACTLNDLWSAACVCAGVVQDTDGDGVCDANDNCPNVAGQQGSACNDGNACTINDVLNASCVCAGTFQDTDGDGICNANDNCPNLAGVQGDACNDGNACTINDVITAACVCAGTVQDTDSDGLCDANDPCPLLADLLNGDACDDGNGATVNDQVVNCVCAGTLPNDCNGVPGGPAQPGTACDDNNACTLNDLWNAGCVCAGVVQDTDGDGICDADDNCPNLSGQQGDACDDGDACTLNDVITTGCACEGTVQDTDGDGLCDADDNCPSLSGQQGDACDDGDVCTLNDVITAGCVCEGTVQDTDSDGLCDANDPCPLLADLLNGDACDDGNAATVNDQVVNCVCAGTLPNDCNGVPGGPAQPGTACDDNNACTLNDLWSAACVCAGVVQDTDGDGLCDADDNCPNLFGQQGDPCDDFNVCTVNDAITAGCVCAGTALDQDGDGICDSEDACPGTFGVPGDACDDGDANTQNDVLGADCSCQGAPLNDACADAATIAVQAPLDCPANATAGTTTNAISTGDAPTCAPQGPLADVWYTFAADTNNAVSITLGPLGLADHGFAVLDACDGAELLCVYQPSTAVELPVEPGLTYLVRVFGTATGAGAFELCVAAGLNTAVRPHTAGELVLAPNPSEGTLRWQWPGAAGTVRWQVRDAAGALVASGSVAAAEGWSAPANVPALVPGVYLVRLESDGQRVERRWVVR